MALDTLVVFGETFTNVKGFKATDSNDQVKTYYRPQGTKSISANGTGIDVAEYASVDVAVTPPAPTVESLSVTPTTSQQTFNSSSLDGYKPVVVAAMPSGSVTAPSSITGTSATVSTGTNTLTLTKTVSVTPSVTTAGYVSSGTAGNSSVSLTASVTTKAAATITPGTTNQTISSGTYLTGTQTISGDSNLVAGNIKSGTSIFGVTGSYTGDGGKNSQTVQNTSRVTSTSLTACSGTITVSKTGTYHVYWSAMRSSTSGTWSTRLYVGGTASGSEQSTWSNHVQNVHLTNVSLTANKTVQVYAKSRGSGYYAYVPQLTIVEA